MPLKIQVYNLHLFFDSTDHMHNVTIHYITDHEQLTANNETCPWGILVYCLYIKNVVRTTGFSESARLKPNSHI